MITIVAKEVFAACGVMRHDTYRDYRQYYTIVSGVYMGLIHIMSFYWACIWKPNFI